MSAKSQSVVSTTFAVDGVTPSDEPFRTRPPIEVLTQWLETREATLESWARDTEPICDFWYGNAFVSTLNCAYNSHFPLVLSPDMIWLLIAQGFAIHVNQNAETLRRRFVDFDGKKLLTVQRDKFVKGFEGNDWEGVFPEFASQIRANIGDQVYGCVVRHFSTTGIVEKAAMEVTLMDAMQAYYKYGLVTSCGFPQITLEGTPADWRSVLAGAQAIATYDLEWWTNSLTPVLEQFVAAGEGKVDLEFWQNLFKESGQSGGPFIGGHIVNLFPYLLEGYEEDQKCVRNLALTGANGRTGSVTADEFPNGIAIAPFTWQYYNQEYPLEFAAGFLGATQDPNTRALRPRITWWVMEQQTASSEE